MTSLQALSSSPLDWRSRVHYFLGPIPLSDAALTAFLCLCAIVEASFVVDYGPSFTYVTNTVVTLVITAATMIRHLAVVTSFVITYLALGALAALIWITPVNLGLNPAIIAAPLSLWTVTRWAPHRIWGFVGLFFGLLGSLINPAVPAFGFSPHRIVYFGTPAVLIMAAAYAIPAWLRSHAETHYAQLAEAVYRSRLELSRELHDVVGHGLTAIKIQAQTALLFAKSKDDNAVTALSSIRDAAEKSLVDVHALIDALREGTQVSADPRQIPAVVRTALPDRNNVELHLPDSYSALSSWPLARRLALVRAATEIATNMAKYSAGHGSITLEIDPSEPVHARILAVNDIVQITSKAAERDVDKHRSAHQHSPQRERVGTGLLGLQERITELGGTMSHRALDGQFRVEILL